MSDAKSNEQCPNCGCGTAKGAQRLMKHPITTIATVAVAVGGAYAAYHMWPEVRRYLHMKRM